MATGSTSPGITSRLRLLSGGAERQRQDLGLEPRNSASGLDGVRWIPEPGIRSLQEPLRGPPLVIGEALPWKDKVLGTVDYGTRAECPAYWPFLTTQQERVVEELGISHLLWAPTAEDSHRWVGDKCRGSSLAPRERQRVF
jgi:hypothetical protein